jgi:uncharacterized protein
MSWTVQSAPTTIDAVSTTLHRIGTAAQVEAIIGEPAAVVLGKQLDHLDAGCRTVLAHSPIAGFAYRSDRPVSTFIGGSPGFARVESPTRISIPAPDDPPAVGSGVSSVFLLPGVGETLRLNGTVARAASMLTIAVDEVYVHCARCIRRAGLWQPTARFDAPLDEVGFLAASPFLIVSTSDGSGGSDTSPRGDRAGFVRFLDEHTLVMPDRRGNRRADTFHNLVADNRIALAVLVPGRTDVLHVNGTAFMTDDPALLASMALNGASPQAALVIDVRSAEIRENAALSRSAVWRQSAHVDRAAVPDLMALASQHLANTRSSSAGRLLARMPRLTRFMVDLGYRMQLGKEGYAEKPEVVAGREVEVVDVVRETADAVTMVFRDVRGTRFRFEPGQFFTFVTDIDGRTVRRAYSASSAPGAKQLRITVKQVPGGTFSGHVNQRLRPGDRLRVLGPSGSFRVDRSQRELVMLAVGSGVTPIMSMIRTLLAKRSHMRLMLLYGNRTEADILFAEELAALRDEHRLTVRHVLTRPPATWTGGVGRLVGENLRRELDALRPYANAHFFVCGPEAMMHGARDVLTALGVPGEQIHEERFTRAPTPTGGEPQPMTVRSGARELGTVQVGAGNTLLDAGLAAGLSMPYSCTVGQCGECMVKLRAGTVDVAQPNCLTPEQLAQGRTLTCVGCPRSPVTIDLGDQGQ